MAVSVKITAYHAGWFEFRLARPEPSSDVTQTLLNEHILEIDPSTPGYPAVLDYADMGGLDGSGGGFKCRSSAGYTDETATSPNEV